MWFPRARRVEDLELLAPAGGLSAAEALELLGDPAGEEWTDKVGVAGPVDGSAKPTTRLLHARGWVLKTRVDERSATADEARSRLEAARARGLAAGLWHPDKRWAVMRVDDAWLPLTLCPALVTLRRVATLQARLAGWSEMLRAGIEADAGHGLGLDLNPANFARAPGGGPLHYLDDELYDGLDACRLAGAIVQRLPEEPTADEATWRGWGGALSGALELGRRAWRDLVDEMRRYPLPARYHDAREALVGALEAPRREAAAARRRGGG